MECGGQKAEDDDGGGFLPWLMVLVWMVLVEAVDEAAAGWMDG